MKDYYICNPNKDNQNYLFCRLNLFVKKSRHYYFEPIRPVRCSLPFCKTNERTDIICKSSNSFAPKSMRILHKNSIDQIFIFIFDGKLQKITYLT